MTNTYNQIAVQIDQEAAALEYLRQNFNDQISFKLQAILNSQVNDTFDRNNIAMQDAAYIGGLTGQMSASMSSFLSTEDSRAAAETVSFTAAVSDATSYVSVNLNTAIANEISRATAAEKSIAATVAFKLPTQTGSNDFASWYV